MRKFLAVICSLLTLFAIRETVYIYTTVDQDVASQRSMLILTALSITIPLFILSFWLWIPKRKQQDE
ncbi:hypothetical protein [Pedobacter rhizosphaerae]|uniref:Uncharacterized protein n=1 Tax=Pedobacter rhizosphaerae TaxID=390241 RepID=A0A1H9K901_9SPHI|nr:hypothetical protein [Pedobacter rhizosphaerae]SEQ95393.1 hypothetical protein SAMN04488023_102263 [Pedobacter rhizosphaerae]